MANTVQIPADLFRRFVSATEAFDELHDAFEDFLILHNPTLLRRLRRARKQQLAGKTRSWEGFKKEFERASRGER